MVDGRLGLPGGGARAGADGTLDSRQDSARRQKSPEPLACASLSAAPHGRAAPAEDDAFCGALGAYRRPISGGKAGRRISAPDCRGRYSLYAVYTPGGVFI